MAEPVRYGNTLESSREDKHLTSTEYIKDKKDGKQLDEVLHDIPYDHLSQGARDVIAAASGVPEELVRKVEDSYRNIEEQNENLATYDQKLDDAVEAINEQSLADNTRMLGIEAKNASIEKTLSGIGTTGTATAAKQVTVDMTGAGMTSANAQDALLENRIIYDASKNGETYADFAACLAAVDAVLSVAAKKYVKQISFVNNSGNTNLYFMTNQQKWSNVTSWVKVGTFSELSTKADADMLFLKPIKVTWKNRYFIKSDGTFSTGNPYGLASDYITVTGINKMLIQGLRSSSKVVSVAIAFYDDDKNPLTDIFISYSTYGTQPKDMIITIPSTASYMSVSAQGASTTDIPVVALYQPVSYKEIKDSVTYYNPLLSAISPLNGWSFLLCSIKSGKNYIVNISGATIGKTINIYTSLSSNLAGTVQTILQKTITDSEFSVLFTSIDDADRLKVYSNDSIQFNLVLSEVRTDAQYLSDNVNSNRKDILQLHDNVYRKQILKTNTPSANWSSPKCAIIYGKSYVVKYASATIGSILNIYTINSASPTVNIQAITQQKVKAADGEIIFVPTSSADAIKIYYSATDASQITVYEIIAVR